MCIRDRTRTSLKPDSNYEILNDVKNTQVVVDTKNIDNKVNSIEEVKQQLDTTFNNTKSDYAERKRAKLELQLEKAEKEAPIVYADLKNLISEGKPINEAINIVKAKYRDSETVEMGVLGLTKDLLEVSMLEKLVVNKENTIADKENTIADRENTITNREETISSLKSTLTTKENDFRLKEEKHGEELTIQAQESEKMIKEVTDVAYTKIQGLESELKETDELIIRLSEQKSIYEKDIVSQAEQLNTKDVTILDLNKKTFSLEQLNELKDSEIKGLEIEIENQKTNLSKANNLISSKDSLIEDLGTKKELAARNVIELEERINNKDIELNTKDENIHTLEQKIEKLENILAQRDGEYKEEINNIQTQQNQKIEKVEEFSEKLLNFMEKLDIMSVDKKDTPHQNLKESNNNERVSDILKQNGNK